MPYFDARNRLYALDLRRRARLHREDYAKEMKILPERCSPLPPIFCSLFGVMNERHIPLRVAPSSKSISASQHYFQTPSLQNESFP
ncbi:MAG: hypothetical protein ACLQMT_10125 [Candidatus Acidiferrales bacterium]